MPPILARLHHDLGTPRSIIPNLQTPHAESLARGEGTAGKMVSLEKGTPPFGATPPALMARIMA